VAHLIPFAYHPGHTALHTLDVRLKFFVICMVSITIVNAALVPCLGYGLILVLLFKAAQVNGVAILWRMKLFLLLLLLVFLSRCFATDGDPLISFFGLAISAQGVLTGFLVTYKFLMVMLTGLLFATTTRPAGVKSAVQWYLKPIPFIPEKRLAVMISLTLSFMPVILKQMQIISDAQAARCGNLEKNPIKRIIRLVLPMLKKVFLSADQLVLAMESRCYADDRTDLGFSTSGKEAVFLFSSLAIAAGFILL